MKKIRPLNKISAVFLWVAVFASLLTTAGISYADDSKGDAAPAVAATSSPLDKLPVDFVPRVGKWVRYRLTERDSGASREISIGVDKAADISGRVGYWMEISTSSAQGVPVHLRFLFDPKTTDGRRIRRFIVKSDQQPAVEVDTHNHSYMLFDPKLGGQWSQPGSEKIETPAGVFEARRARFVSDKDEALEVWLSDKVPLTGLLRVNSISQNMELVAFGSNYSAVVSEEIKFRLSSDGVKAEESGGQAEK